LISTSSERLFERISETVSYNSRMNMLGKSLAIRVI